MESPLKNCRHERFAQLVANGKTQADAYREVYPNQAGQKASTLATNACRLHTKVLPRIKELQQATAERFTMTREEALNILAEALRASPGDVKPDSRFAQEFKVDAKTGDITVRLPSKVSCFSEIAKTCGWYAPVKQQVDQEFNWKPDEAVMARIGEALAKAQARKGGVGPIIR